MSDQLQRLKQALEAHHRALDELENALVEFEEAFDGQAPRSRGPELLSIPQVCRSLGMGKSWTYRRLKSGEIPSVKLGRSIKVKREELEQYLENRRYWPSDEE